jgi:hypothetical protein
VSSSFIIKTSLENHLQIKVLLADVRESSSLKLAFEAQLILLTDTAIIDLGRNLSLDFEKQHDNDAATILIIDDFEAKRLIKAVTATDGAHLIGIPRITQFNNQSSWARIQKQTPYIADYRKSDTGEIDLVLATANEGFTFTAKGSISKDRRQLHATLDVTLLNITLPLAKRPWPGDEQGLMIEDPAMQTLTSGLSIDLPDKATVLIDTGKTTVGPLSGDHANDKIGEDVERRLWLLVRPTIIIQDEDSAIVPGMPEASAP